MATDSYHTHCKQDLFSSSGVVVASGDSAEDRKGGDEKKTTYIKSETTEKQKTKRQT